jgi:hypothetical protein
VRTEEALLLLAVLLGQQQGPALEAWGLLLALCCGLQRSALQGHCCCCCCWAG